MLKEMQKQGKDRWKCLQITRKCFTTGILSQGTLLCRACPGGTPNVSKSLHNFSSNCLRAVCRADKHYAAVGESSQITFLCLYCLFPLSRSREQKTGTGHFRMHNFSSGTRIQPEKGHHFLPIIF